MTDRTAAFALFAAAPVFLLVALGVTHFEPGDIATDSFLRGRVDEIWVLGTAWFFLCVGAAGWSWRQR